MPIVIGKPIFQPFILTQSFYNLASKQNWSGDGDWWGWWGKANGDVMVMITALVVRWGAWAVYPEQG